MNIYAFLLLPNLPNLVPRGSQKLPKRWDIGCPQPIASWGLLRGTPSRRTQ